MFEGISGVVWFLGSLGGLFTLVIFYFKNDTFRKYTDAILTISPDLIRAAQKTINVLPIDKKIKKTMKKITPMILFGINNVEQMKNDIKKEANERGLSSEKRHELYREKAMEYAKEMAEEFGGVKVDVLSKSMGDIMVNTLSSFYKKNNEKKDVTVVDLDKAKRGE